MSSTTNEDAGASDRMDHAGQPTGAERDVRSMQQVGELETHAARFDRGFRSRIFQESLERTNDDPAAFALRLPSIPAKAWSAALAQGNQIGKPFEGIAAVIERDKRIISAVGRGDDDARRAEIDT